MLLFLFTILLICFTPSFPYSLSGNTLKDLDSNDATLFQTDANAWTHSPLLSTATISYCYGSYLLGGFNVLKAYGYFSRYYSGLPSHNMIRFSANLRRLDSWDAGDTFKIQFDSLPAQTGWDVTALSSGTQTNKCGGSWADAPFIAVIIELPHSASDITVLMTSYFDQVSTDESMGFRDVTMTFYSLAAPPTTQTFCGVTSFPLGDRWCSCQATNEYMAPAKSGSCYPCDPSCATCTSATQYNCLTCYLGYYLASNQCFKCDSSCKTCNGGGQYKCLSCPPEKYLTDLGNCVGSCPLPLINPATQDFTEYCSSPCTATSTYLYPDMSCQAGCNFPMIAQTVSSYFLVCYFPCQPHEFAFYNGSCGTSCPPPLTTVVSWTRRFCNYGCSSTQVLYWDGSCGTTCTPSPPAISYAEGTGVWVRNFCGYPCQATEYLYWNGSCLTTCPSPLTVSVSHNSNFCNYGCSSSQYLYWDGSCSSTCATATKPLIQKTEGSPARKFCYFPCEIDEFLYWNGTCSEICIPPLVSSYSNSRSYCNYPCGSLQFLNWDGTCVGSCNSPPFSQRIEAGMKYCDYLCAPPTPYLYWNGSCLAACQNGLQISTQGPAYFCNFPCSNTNDFLYFNGTCASYCSAPLIPRTEGTPLRKFCDYPCDGYLYWNTTCSSECPSPLVFYAVAGKKYCDYPCKSASGAGTTSASQFLYWNSSCLSTCNFPFQVIADGSVTYCNYPCSSEEYVYWDGTCETDCSAPLKSSTQISASYPYVVQYCSTGCSSSSQYLYWNGVCSNSCRSPLRKGTYKGKLFCDQPCQNTAYYYYPDVKTCKQTCPGPYYGNNTATPYLSCMRIAEEDSWFARQFLTAPDAQGEVTLIRVVKLMEHMRYLDIKMPPRLDKLIMSKGRNILSFNYGWKMSEEMQSYFIENELPEVFDKHSLSSNFIVNFWQDFTMLWVILALAAIFPILENITKILELTMIQCFFERLRALFKWNLVLVFLALCMDDIVLYSSLQFRSSQSPREHSQDYIYIAFNLISTLAAIFFSIGLMGAGFFFIYATRSKTEGIEAARNIMFNNPDFSKKYQDFQVIFQGYNASNIWTHSFYLIYVIRVCYLPMLIASYLYEFPLAQTILQVGISLGILAYILLMRPLENKVNAVQLIISESLVLFMNGCLLVLKCLEMGGVDEKSKTVIVFGDFVIGGNVLFNITWIVFLWIKLLSEVREIYKHIGRQQDKERGIWIELLVVWVQQGGMGFEEIKIRQIADVESINSFVDDPEENHMESNGDLLKENEEINEKEEKQKESQNKGISLRVLNSKDSRKYLMRNNLEGIRLNESEISSINQIEVDRLETRVNLGGDENQLPRFGEGNEEERNVNKEYL